MERREFLKIAVGVVAGGAVFVTTAQAAPLLPQPLLDDPKEPHTPAQPAVTSQEEIDRLELEEVKGGRGGRGRHRGWGRGRHLGWYRGRRRRRW
jgi:hypothetical protein